METINSLNLCPAPSSAGTSQSGHFHTTTYKPIQPMVAHNTEANTQSHLLGHIFTAVNKCQDDFAVTRGRCRKIYRAGIDRLSEEEKNVENN